MINKDFRPKGKNISQLKDMKNILDCAKNANWPCIIFSKGYSDIDIKKLNAFKIFNNYKELPDIIFDYFEQKNSN